MIRLGVKFAVLEIKFGGQEGTEVKVTSQSEQPRKFGFAAHDPFYATKTPGSRVLAK